MLTNVWRWLDHYEIHGTFQKAHRKQNYVFSYRSSNEPAITRQPIIRCLFHITSWFLQHKLLDTGTRRLSTDKQKPQLHSTAVQFSSIRLLKFFVMRLHHLQFWLLSSLCFSNRWILDGFPHQKSLIKTNLNVVHIVVVKTKKKVVRTQLSSYQLISACRLFLLVSRLAYSSTLKIETIFPSETSTCLRTTTKTQKTTLFIALLFTKWV